tara:strand:- start:1976 stop:3091 length:1116 start_codon:yes stop_codon:yes gene_type:complete
MSKIEKNKKINVSILGATGLVGQNLVNILIRHPWFNIIDLAASKNSAGQNYYEKVKTSWNLPNPIPNKFKKITLRDALDVNSMPNNVECVFCALSLVNKLETKKLELNYARNGYPVISNNSANRDEKDIPMIIPEINPEHSSVIPYQQKRYSLPKTGFIAVKPNCSIQSYLIVVNALNQAGYPINKVQVSTLQAISGAGQRGLESKIFKKNVVPFIDGEEEKTVNEPLKILGSVSKNGIANCSGIDFSATCTRVPVIEGHTAIVHISFKKNIPSINKVKKIIKGYISPIKKMNLPMSPQEPIVYLNKENRPQPRFDSNLGNGMSVSIGRLSKDKFFNLRFIGLSNNIIRGASGGAIQMAELLIKQGFINVQ